MSGRSHRLPARYNHRDERHSRSQESAERGLCTLKLTPVGVNLRFIRGLVELGKTLSEAAKDAFTVEFKQWWAGETERIARALTSHRKEVAAFLQQTIGLSELEKVFGGDRVLAAGPPIVEDFHLISPEPEGAADDPLPFSCDVSVSYTVTVERQLALLAWYALLGHEAGPPTERPAPTLCTDARKATIELAAQISPDYSRLTLQTARIRI